MQVKHIFATVHTTTNTCRCLSHVSLFVKVISISPSLHIYIYTYVYSYMTYFASREHKGVVYAFLAAVMSVALKVLTNLTRGV